MVGSRWLKILCHYPYQEVDIISPPFESGLAPSVEPIGCRRTALSSSRPSLSEDCTFCFFFLGVLALGTLPLGTQLPCWEGPKPHTHRAPQPVSIGSPMGEPSWTSQPSHTLMTSRAAEVAQWRPVHTREPESQERIKCFKLLWWCGLLWSNRLLKFINKKFTRRMCLANQWGMTKHGT